MSRPSPLWAWLLLGAACQVVAEHGAQEPITGPTVGSKASSANFLLYPGSRVHPDDLKSLGKEMRPCSGDSAPTQVGVELGTCLSGDYYPRENFKITELPACSDGSMPNISFYRERGCVGHATWTREASRLLNTCLLSERVDPYPSYYWSLILHCSAYVSGTHEVVKHREAAPTIAHQITGGVKGEVTHYSGSVSICKADDRMCPFTFSSEVDGCHIPSATFGLKHLLIMSPAICPNGTRAQLALFEDTGEDDLAYLWGGCNGGEVTFEKGLLDINDEDVGRCISMRNFALKRGGRGNAKGYMWHCDGQEVGESRDKAKDAETANALVSHTDCGAYPWHKWEVTNSPPLGRWPTWMEVPAETCVDIHDRQSLHVRKLPPSCANGSEPLLATWSAPGCAGTPDKVAGIRAGLREPCETFYGPGGSGSYAFRCDERSERVSSRVNDL